jgi:starch-binding outer membrane protein, SusD/RagB family
MKLYNIKYIKLFCTVLVFMTFSCQKLIEDPKGSLVKTSFFKTESDLAAAVTACYYPLGEAPWNAWNSSRMWIPLMGADDLTTHPAWNKQSFREFDRFVATDMNSDLMSAAWQQPFNMVIAAANVMENYEKVIVPGREAIVNQYVAQARFLRAFAYFWMTRVFGDLPLVTSTITDLNIPLSKVKDIYTLIIDDLQFAEANLPDSWPGEPGKPNKWTAESLLSSVYLTMGGWPLKATENYALAAAAAKDVIDNGPYTLLPNFADLWTMANNNNNEFIWTLQMVGLPGNPQLSTITGLVTMPDEEEGWDDVFFEIGFYNRFPSGPRKDATFHTVFQDGPGAPVTDFRNSITGHPFIEKYRDGALKWLPSFCGNQYMVPRNICHLRFAEILLCYAEAQARGADPSADAYAAVNRVRARAGLTDLQPGLPQGAFCDSIVAERGWELAGEYSRWFDLIRTEKVEEMAALKDPLDLQPLTPPSIKIYHAPIPHSEVLLNPKLGLGHDAGYGTDYPK